MRVDKDRDASGLGMELLAKGHIKTTGTIAFQKGVNARGRPKP